MSKNDSLYPFRFLPGLLAGAILTGVVFFPFTTLGSVEGKNLQVFTLRQIDFLINRVDSGEPFDRQSQKIVDKIAENLEILSAYQKGPLKSRDFDRIADRLYTAAEDWDNAQLTDAKVGLLKAKTLLASFAF